MNKITFSSILLGDRKNIDNKKTRWDPAKKAAMAQSVTICNKYVTSVKHTNIKPKVDDIATRIQRRLNKDELHDTNIGKYLAELQKHNVEATDAHALIWNIIIMARHDSYKSEVPKTKINWFGITNKTRSIANFISNKTSENSSNIDMDHTRLEKVLQVEAKNNLANQLVHTYKDSSSYDILADNLSQLNKKSLTEKSILPIYTNLLSEAYHQKYSFPHKKILIEHLTELITSKEDTLFSHTHQKFNYPTAIVKVADAIGISTPEDITEFAYLSGIRLNSDFKDFLNDVAIKNDALDQINYQELTQTNKVTTKLTIGTPEHIASEIRRREVRYLLYSELGAQNIEQNNDGKFLLDCDNDKLQVAASSMNEAGFYSIADYIHLIEDSDIQQELNTENEYMDNATKLGIVSDALGIKNSTDLGILARYFNITDAKDLVQFLLRSRINPTAYDIFNFAMQTMYHGKEKSRVVSKHDKLSKMNNLVTHILEWRNPKLANRYKISSNNRIINS